MINCLINLALLFVSLGLLVLSVYKISGLLQICFIFISGILLGCFFMNINLTLKNSKIISYKRELEKESLVSDSNAAKVKVLEAKIDVLEKALENALNNK